MFMLLEADVTGAKLAQVNGDATTPAGPVRVAIVEDDPGTRQSLALLIGGTPGFHCVGVHADAEAALAGIPSSRPDVVLMDIQLPRLSGLECVHRLKPRLPAVQFIMLTVFEDDERVFDSLAAGATGYLLKRASPAEILEAIAEAHRGGSPMTSAIARKVVQAFHRPPPAAAATTVEVSPREQQILTLLSRGYRYKEIAEQLGIALDTVRSHIRRLYEKLQVTSRTEAVVKFLGR
jgi:DNA-binding NarL/FixJ family response regulator